MRVDLAVKQESQGLVAVPDIATGARLPRADASALVVITSVAGNRDGDHVILDRKAFEGLEFRVKHWPGPVCWMLSFVDEPLTYANRYDPAALPFEIIEIAQDRSDVAEKAPRNAIIEASADNFRELHLARELPGRIVYILEYTLRTRLDILRISDVPLHVKARRLLWELMTERRRRRAIRDAAGLLCNGLPAYRRYKSLAREATYYLDTRMTQAMQINEQELHAKQESILRGEPLRLAFSGRLERMKGAYLLLPLMRALDAAGMGFRFEIFGAGPQYDELKAASAGEMTGRLVVHGPVPFTEELIPALKKRIDLFVCPHPQGDPSCTYMETLSCGVPIVGFANEAWALMLGSQSFGKAVPIGDVAALAAAIRKLDQNCSVLAMMAGEAAQFSAKRTFEAAFAERLRLLSEIAAALPK